MRTKFLLALAALAVAAVVVILLGQPNPGPATATGGNTISTPDMSGDVRGFTSLALDSSGNPVVAYADVNYGGLKVLHCGNATCTSGNSIASLDMGIPVAWGISLALDASGNPVVSYHAKYPISDLKLLRCNDPNCAGGGESITSPDTSGSVGAYSSLALDASGNPVISYLAENWNLKVMHCNDPNCSGGDESIVMPADAGTVGSPGTSLVLDASGNPVVSYHDNTITEISNGRLKLLHCGNANCTSGNVITEPDPDAANNTGLYTDMVLDSAGNPVISHYDANLSDLKVLHCNDPNCAGGDESTTSPDPDGDLWQLGWDTSIALDSSGYPVVSYYDVVQTTLRVVHCNDANCSGDDEVISVPDSDGSVGRFTSLALDSAGNPVVSYYASFPDQNLKLLHCGDPNCSGEKAPPPPPSFRSLAEHWAPVIYQDTDSANPDRDYITNFDFDGNWDGIDNWDNQPSNALNANVYYWVVETWTNWFIGYGIYHPRDWEDVCLPVPMPLPPPCHENDMEGVLLTIQRDSSSFGQFLLMNTLSHFGFLNYKDDAPPSASVTGPFDGEDVQFSGTSPLVYVKSRSHRIEGADPWQAGPSVFPGGDGVVYTYNGVASPPANGNDRTAGYDLRDIQELWSRRCDFLGGTVEQAFASFGTLRGDDGYQDNKADAPWGWTDFFGPRPDFFLDPAKGISSNFGGLGSFSPSYSDASFSPGPNDSAEVSCMPIELGDGVSLTYEQVTGTGVTTNSTSSTGPLTPANYQPGTPAVYHDLLTTSTFSGSIEVCSDYDESTYELEKGIRLFHYDGQAWDDITTNLDTTNDRVCGVTLDLSPFHLAEIIPGQDLDGDGCTNGSELGFDPTLGGLRDYENPWDFYDVLGPGAALPVDGVIDLPNDILGVILHFSPQGQALYDVNFDRGPSSGPNAWNMTAPDGVIDLPNDILGVILQFGHRCV